jgi:hypothetical protein
MKTLALTALLAATLTFAACGGDDDDNGSPAPGNGGAAATATSPSGGNGGQPGNGSGGVEPGTAVVTIGEDRYEFDLSVQCLALFGNLAGFGRSVDGRDITINIETPPEDWETSDEEWEPPSIRVDDGENDIDWRAGDEIIREMVDEGVSEVTSFTNKDKRASGTATFVDLYAVMRGEIEPVEGTFEFACP